MKVYLSPSQQEHNIGVLDYGSEAKRCMDIARRVGKLLVKAGVSVKQTPDVWLPLSDTTWLSKVVALSNSFDPDVHIAMHTNASSSKLTHGTDAWYYPGSVKGKAVTKAVYDRVVKVSGKGNGIHTSPVFYETKYAKSPVCYIELGFHTNYDDVRNLVANPDKFALAIADGLLDYLGVKAPVEPVAPYDALVKVAQYPALKDQMLGYMLKQQLAGTPVSVVDATGFRVRPLIFGPAAKKLAWRISGQLEGVKQTARPTVELYEALKRR